MADKITTIPIQIQILEEKDIPTIVNGFEKSGWQTKSETIFKHYLKDQNHDLRICFIAFLDTEFAGYVTLKWQSSYKSFAKKQIPEISDLNVLPAFRNQGIGSLLIKTCENKARERASQSNIIIGIGVGLYPDYGSAQRLYSKLGFLLDGEGATYDYERVIPGLNYTVDDDLILWFTKVLKK